MSKDLNFPFPVANFNQGKDESDHHQQQQMSSRLLRYRSAPSTLLGEACEEFLPHRSTGIPEAESSIVARFVAPDLRDHVGGGRQEACFRVTPPLQQSSSRYTSSASQMVFQSPPTQPPPSMSSVSPAAAESPFPAMSSMAVEQGQQIKGGDNANLVRHSSSPAGFFSHLGVENGFGVMNSNSTRLNTQISFSSRQGSSGLMSQISEIDSEVNGGGGDGDIPEECGLENDGNAGGGGRCYIPDYPVTSWDDSVLLSDSFSGSKRGRDSSESQNGGEMGSNVWSLSHHLSLTKSATEVAAMDKYFQFQDVVPCKIRAKRGCATHPRSIAERVRRTKISERIRKLQELVPNMDKQTNTSDMLELAVEHIKDLQKQVKTLMESQANCSCPRK